MSGKQRFFLELDCILSLGKMDFTVIHWEEGWQCMGISEFLAVKFNYKINYRWHYFRYLV